MELEVSKTVILSLVALLVESVPSYVDHCVALVILGAQKRVEF